MAYNSGMRTVSVKVARQDLSKSPQEAERGERIFLERRGEPAAELVPHQRSGMSGAEQDAARRRMDVLFEERLTPGEAKFK